MMLGTFTEQQVSEPYWQHTAATGQEFTPEAAARAYDCTQGQPWLVNALAAEVIDEMRVEPAAPVTADHIRQAKERLILTRATHLHSLAAKLYEPKVRRVIEPMLTGEFTEPGPAYNDDVEYVGTRA